MQRTQRVKVPTSEINELRLILPDDLMEAIRLIMTMNDINKRDLLLPALEAHLTQKYPEELRMIRAKLKKRQQVQQGQ